MKLNPSLSCRLLLLTAALLPAGGLTAAVFSGSWNSGFSSSGVVPDGSATGWSDVRSLPIPGNQVVTDVNVTLSLSGGWNGDLYAYLTNPNSPGVAVLLNRPGRTGGNPFGYSDAALTITLDDGAANGETHTYQSATGYATLIGNASAWQPDGRSVNPFTVTGSEPRTALLNVFNGSSPASSGWTLFVADLASGSQSTITSWGLTITTVPEPHVILTGALAGALLLTRRRCNRIRGRR